MIMASLAFMAWPRLAGVLSIYAFAARLPVVAVMWFAIRLVDSLADIWEERASVTETRLDDQLVPIIRRSSKVFFFVIGVVLVLQNMGYSVGSLLAGLGIGFNELFGALG